MIIPNPKIIDNRTPYALKGTDNSGIFKCDWCGKFASRANILGLRCRGDHACIKCIDKYEALSEYRSRI